MVSTLNSIELSYTIAELPSSQHRSGLAGLILVAKEILKRGNSSLSIEELTEYGARISISFEGLKCLLDEIYEASEEMQGRNTPLQGVEPASVEDRTETDQKTGKTKTKKSYFYPVIVPKGSFLFDADESENKSWVKLWRNMVWSIMRGVPATRKPFEDRAARKKVSDADTIWKQLNQDTERSIDLASTYFIGAQAVNSEGVSFKDKSRYQFLLHFWTFVAQTYIPEIIDRDGKRSFEGFCLAIPDIKQLKSFVSDYPLVLKLRGNQEYGYRPKESIVEIPLEAGLDTFRRLNHVVSESSSKAQTSDLVFGLDILHTAKEGNNVRLLYSGRIEPDRNRDEDYARLKHVLKDSSFKRQRLVNLLLKHKWYYGYDKLLCKLPIEQGLKSPYFAADVRTCFEMAKIKAMEEQMETIEGRQVPEDALSLETLILKIMDDYVRKKLDNKYDLNWKRIDGDEAKSHYNDKRDKIVEACFYAVRSRAGDDFINYFASTICSVPHWMSREGYIKLTQELYTDTEHVRTLCMLALSARIGRFEQKEGTHS